MNRFAHSSKTACLTSTRCQVATMVTMNRKGQRIYSPTQSRHSVLPEANRFTTLHDWYMTKSQHYHNRVAAVCGVSGKEVTYLDMIKRTEQLAAELYHTYHIRAGDMVAIMSPNTLDFGCIFHAALRLGAQVTTVNPLYSAEELRMQVDLSGAKLVATISMFQGVPQQTAEMPSKATGNKEPLGILLLDRPLQAGDKTVPTSDLGYLKGKVHDTIVVPFSSGTTGLPKGVQLTNRNLVVNILQTENANSTTPEDVTMAVLPYYHIYGMTVVMHGAVNNGGKQIVFPKFDLVQYLEKLQQYKATLLYVAPPMIIGFVKHPATQQTDRSSVRRVLSGAAPLHREVQKMAEALFPNGVVCQGYGLTETSPVATVALPRTYGSAGSVLSDTEMRIVRVDDQQMRDGFSSEGVFKDAEEGQEGEVWFRGPQVMKGYLRQEDTDKVMVDGWFRTGDIGRVDQENEHLIITDRLKELIKFKGFQVAPAELEGIIQTHPLVQDTVVVGIPDPLDTGCELPRAQVVLKPTATPEDIQNAEHIISSFVDQHVAPYKKLRGGIRVVAAIPKSPAGKLLRRIAKTQEIEYLNEHPRFPHAHYGTQPSATA